MEIEALKKALSVRLKGIPEGVIFLSFNITKTLINKGLYKKTRHVDSQGVVLIDSALLQRLLLFLAYIYLCLRRSNLNKNRCLSLFSYFFVYFCIRNSPTPPYSQDIERITQVTHKPYLYILQPLSFYSSSLLTVEY